MSETAPVQALKLEGIHRSFKSGQSELQVLKGANLEIGHSQIVSLVGPSGAGKSTLLQICGLLEPPTSGEVHIAGERATGLSDDKRTALRRHHLGFVYQYHHLLPEFSALENVSLPQMIAGITKREAEVRAKDLLERVGLGGRLDHRPGQLSGGEQQRVAIARALANKPKLLLADEPTGNLDPETSAGVFKELMHLVRDEGLSALIATHNPDLAQSMDRVVRLENGILV